MEGELRNLRDFLMVYNKMTEMCFTRCAKNLNYRTLTMDEEKCLDSCASKLIRSNHRLMGAYVRLMPAVVTRRMEDMEKQSRELEASAQANVEVANPMGGAADHMGGAADHMGGAADHMGGAADHMTTTPPSP
ncbi:mitochondrial import inner membrane translocase subunit Tim10 B [Hyperolius riggenbachi]|uniref:mitochondrial import inner membrane translocase subunit Tim10 B n=1 Tax=Hyperolius riggenbachi TaxID=752182 RepID=UPI0035A390FA